MKYLEFSEIVGFVFVDIIYDTDKETLVFTRDTGQTYNMWHEQDCCEHVYLAEIIGSMSDLLDTPILWAEVSSSDDPTACTACESGTWTFYKLATRKGYVDFRWHGSSNGYYAEGVSFAEDMQDENL